MHLLSLYLITDRRQRKGRSLIGVLREAFEGGVKMVQLREKDLPGKALYELACEVKELAEVYGAKVLINDRIDVAIAAELDGIHLPSDSFAVTETRRLLGEERIIGVSTHSLDDAFTAEREGADFVTFSPIYYTPSKAGYGTPQGLESLEEVCTKVNIPVYALGGIKIENIREIMGRGASGVALISAILGAKDIKAETGKLLKSLNEV